MDGNLSSEVVLLYFGPSEQTVDGTSCNYYGYLEISEK